MTMSSSQTTTTTDTTDNEGNDAHQQRSAPDRNYLSISDTDKPAGPAIIVDVMEPSDHSEVARVAHAGRIGDAGDVGQERRAARAHGDGVGCAQDAVFAVRRLDGHFAFACDAAVSADEVDAGARQPVDLAGVVLFLLPLCGYIFYESLPYLLSSWSVGERSREASGLPALYLLKAIIPIMAALLIFQGHSLVLRCIVILRKAD